jgi:hypothetical protein
MRSPGTSQRSVRRAIAWRDGKEHPAAGTAPGEVLHDVALLLATLLGIAVVAELLHTVSLFG